MEDAKKWVAYYRVSTPRQGISGLGLEAQREAVVRFIAGKGQPLAEFTEIETGKGTRHRPQLEAAFAECRKHKAVLLIAKLDRLARNVHFISGLMNSRVEFIAVDMPSANRLTIHILAAVAEHECEMTSKRTKEALAAAKARGVKLGNPRLDEARARAADSPRRKELPESTISLIADLRAYKTLREIAGQLNAYGVKTPRGGKWHAGSVRAALLRHRPGAYTPFLPRPESGITPSENASHAGRIFEGAIMPSDFREAERMIDLFTSVGATRFHVTFLDLLGRKTRYYPERTIPSMRYNLSSWMAEAAKRKPSLAEDGSTVPAGESISIRPVCRIPETAVTFVQLDDLKERLLDRVRPASFIIFATSPGNYQAWIAVSGYKGETSLLCNRVREALGAGDGSATGSTRLAGTENFKPKYAGNFPMVTIVHGVPGRVMTLGKLKEMHLLAEPKASATPQPEQRPRISAAGRTWPSYEMSLAGAPRNSEGTGPDRSKADWWWCYLAAQRGFSVDEIAAELERVSVKAQEMHKHHKTYALDKARDASATWASKATQRSRA